MPHSEVAELRAILRRVEGSPQWWARLSYPARRDYWTDEERAVLDRAFGTK